MIIINEIQQGLSTAQAIPVIGPIVFSLPKAALSTAQIICGLVVGIFTGMIATASESLRIHTLSYAFGSVAFEGFKESILGFGSLFYACLNLSTLGIAGMMIESLKGQGNISDMRRTFSY